MSTVVAIVQARMRSTRLPAKVMADVAGKPLIGWVLDRTAKAARLAAVWLACTDEAADDPLAAYAEGQGFKVFRGSEADVLSRFVAVARLTDADVIVRICGDCPLIDPDVIDDAVALFQEGGADYASNCLQRSYPDGLDVEVFSRAALEQTEREATDPFLRAHVTPYIHGRLKGRVPTGDFTRVHLVGRSDFTHLRWTVDEPEDLDLMRRLVPLLPRDFGWLDVVAVLTREPSLARMNAHRRPYLGTERDLVAHGHAQAAARSFAKSDALFERASALIPLASQTFSKSHQQVVRGAAPLFIQGGKGCRIRDVDGNEYIDYVMGLMPVILGYGDPDVDAAITRQLEDGITFSLASPLETELAERLVRLIPCAEQVRFGKNGSDATSAAIRLARAHTGRDKVMMAGYHGWHDWYIGTTTRDLGVPAAVKALSHKVPYNDLDAVETLLKAEPDAFAALILEPASTAAPHPGYLEGLRALTDRYGVVLVFDEIVTGFRMALGGAQAHYGVIPDLACFGKAMANGMPIAAVVGRADIMARMEDIFFSATFGGEALSIAAAIATLDKLEREDLPARLWRRGDALRDAANRVFDRRGLGNLIRFEGDGWWPRINVGAGPVDANIVRSLLRQEFIAEGLYLLSSLNLSLAHDDDVVVRDTLSAMDVALGRVADALDSPDPAACLKGPPIQQTFSVR